jgi:group I intron endonuclease
MQQSSEMCKDCRNLPGRPKGRRSADYLDEYRPGVIYEIVNIENGKIYIGKTVGTAEKRLLTHIANSGRGYRNQSYFYRAIRKYGVDNFIVGVIDQADCERDLDVKEIEWITKLDSTNPEIGYNSTTGGEGGRHSESSLALRKGIPRPPEVIAKISAANKGKKRSPEQVERLRLLNLGRKQPQEEIEHRRESNRKTWANNPEKKAKQSEAIRKRCADPAYKERVSASRKPPTDEQRQAVSERFRKYWASPAADKAKQNMRERQTALTPAERRERAKKMWKTRHDTGDMYEFKAKASEKRIAWWQNPDNKKLYTDVIWNEQKRVDASLKGKEYWASEAGIEMLAAMKERKIAAKREEAV